MIARGGRSIVAALSAIPATTVLLAMLSPGAASLVSAAVAVVLWLAVAWFFRDPERAAPASSADQTDGGDGVLLSPADGRVVRADSAADGRDTLISIYLSLFDVHVQRSPTAGRVSQVARRRGPAAPAYDPAARSNRGIITTLETDAGQLQVRQLAGVVARRCISYVTVGEQLRSGQRIGMIRFGSRVEVQVPAAAGATCLVGVGDRVRAGLTPLLRVPAAVERSR